MGRKYKIVHERMEDNHGLCDSNLGLIKLDRGLEQQLAREIILHEAMHAVLRQQGREYTKVEETYVTALAPGLVSVLRANPKLVHTILEPDRE